MARLPWLFRTNSFLRPLENIPELQIWDNLGFFFSFYVENGILCVLIDEAILIRTYNIQSFKENRKDIPILPPDLTL